MKYDLEVCIPLCSKGKFLQRGLNLKQYGLINNGGYKTLVKLLIGPTDEFPDIEQGWESGIDVSVEQFEFDWPAQKIYSYYSNINPNRARWFAKFDDDSITDISGLIKNLDREYDYAREFYLVTMLLVPGKEHEIDYKLWYELGYKDTDTLYTEREGSIVSQAALKKMMETSNAKNLMQNRAKFSGGYGDVALGMAARIAKVHACKANFLCDQPYFQHFSLWGGHLNHLHFTYTKPEIIEFWTNKIDNEDKTLKEKLNNRKFTLERPNSNRYFIDLTPEGLAKIGDISIGAWLINKNGRLDIYTGWNEAIVLKFDLFDENYTRLEDRSNNTRLERQ